MPPSVGELVLVAAPSCCGKSYFLNELLSGRLKDVEMQLGLSSPVVDYVSLIPPQLKSIECSYIPKLIMHYALPTIAINDGSLKTLSKDPRLQIMYKAQKLSSITLVASQKILESRLRARYRANLKMLFFNFFSYLSDRRRMIQLKDLYSNPESIILAYETWFKFVKNFQSLDTELLVTTDDHFEVFSTDDWMRIRDHCFPMIPGKVL